MAKKTTVVFTTADQTQEDTLQAWLNASGIPNEVQTVEDAEGDDIDAPAAEGSAEGAAKAA